MHKKYEFTVTDHEYVTRTININRQIRNNAYYRIDICSVHILYT